MQYHQVLVQEWVLYAQAICKIFLEACEKRQIRLPAEKNFTLSYETNIPRQAGLSGSSAIVCAALNCLLEFYGVGERCASIFPDNGCQNLVSSCLLDGSCHSIAFVISVLLQWSAVEPINL